LSFDLCRKEHLLALAKGFDRFADRIERTDEKMDWRAMSAARSASERSSGIGPPAQFPFFALNPALSANARHVKPPALVLP